jgi:hypothetical protein
MNAQLPLPAVCAHCGESTLAGTQYCCAGCAAAADWIRSAGLADYYRLRSEAGNRVPPEAVDLRAWDREDVQRLHARVEGEEREIRLALEGMHCAACAWLVDRALAQQAGVVGAWANAASGRLRLRWRPADTTLSALLQRLHALGYRAFLGGDEARAQLHRRERNALLLRLGVAALVGMQAMMFAEAAWLDPTGQMPAATREMFRWLTLLLCTPVVFWCGMPILSGMRRELALLRPGMDTLAGSSILLAYGASVVETLRGGPQVWFDAAAMFVFFLLLARVIERFARDRAGERLDLLARAQPQLAWRLRAGALEQVPALELQAGDEVRVRADETCPPTANCWTSKASSTRPCSAASRRRCASSAETSCLPAAAPAWRAREFALPRSAPIRDWRSCSSWCRTRRNGGRRSRAPPTAPRDCSSWRCSPPRSALSAGGCRRAPVSLSRSRCRCWSPPVPARSRSRSRPACRRPPTRWPGAACSSSAPTRSRASRKWTRSCSTRPARSPTARRGCARCSVSRPRARRRLRWPQAWNSTAGIHWHVPS